MTEHEQIGYHVWRKRSIKAVGAMAATAALAIPYASLTRQNNVATHAADEMARALAAERNTCAIKDAHFEPAEFGGSVLAITIALQGRVNPNSYNQKLDKFGADVTFEDEIGNLASGVRVFRLAPDGSVEKGMFTSRENEGPSSVVNTTEVSEPLLQIDDKVHKYSVQRQNAVRARIDGPLVSDDGYMRSALVNCGTIEYNEQGHLAIVAPEG